MVLTNFLIDIFFWGLLVSGVVYSLILVLLWFGLYKLSRKKINQNSSKPSVSILICARNEEFALESCLSGVLAQDYDGDWEILIADDRSTDSTPQIIAKYAQIAPHKIRSLRIDSHPVGISPKKRLITELVNLSKADILLLTDADCEHPTTWLKSMVEAFQGQIEWVSGYSELKSYGSKKPMLDGLQALDFLSHRTVAAAGVGLGIHITSCGQNLAYLRKTFIELEGFKGVEHILSGDDDLLMHKLSQKRPNAIAYNLNPQSFVLSLGAPTWKAAWEQRKRWASKTNKSPLPTLILLSLVFAWFVLLLLSFPTAITLGLTNNSWKLLEISIYFVFWKFFVDFLVMQAGFRIFNAKHLIRWYIPMSIIQIPMIVGAVFMGIFGRIKWRN